MTEASSSAPMALAESALSVVDKARNATVRLAGGGREGEVAFGKHATVRRNEIRRREKESLAEALQGADLQSRRSAEREQSCTPQAGES